MKTVITEKEADEYLRQSQKKSAAKRNEQLRQLWSIHSEELSDEQSLELMRRSMAEYETELSEQSHRRYVAEGRERLRKEAAEKDLPEPKFDDAV